MWTKMMSGPRKKAPKTIAVIDPDRCFGAFACSICQAAWQIEHAYAPKQRSGSITAIVFGAFLRGPDIILVHIPGL